MASDDADAGGSGRKTGHQRRRSSTSRHNRVQPSPRTTDEPTGTQSLPPAQSSLPSHSLSTGQLASQLGDLGSPYPKDRHLADRSGILTSAETKLGDLNVVAAYKAHFRESPFEFLQQFVAYGQGTGWRGYSNYIGAPILYPGMSDETIRAVLASDQVQERIRRLAALRIDALFPDTGPMPPSGPTKAQKSLAVFKQRKQREMEGQLRDVAHHILVKSVARIDSLRFLKAFAASVNNVLARMYHQGIHISVPQVLELRRVAAYAAERKQSIIFLPCHKSHIDYLTVSWLMYRLGIALPHIVAGENLDLPVVGNILRGGGGFFIRRSFAGDQLYPIVIKEYIENILANGRNLECFIEGTRSRTGKLLPPKLGILKYVVEGLLAGRTDDVWVCPVSLQYDSVIESETYVSELLGKPKESESLLGLLSGSSSLLQLKMGRIDIRFDTPWSLQGFIEEQKARRAAPGPDDTKVELDIRNSEQHKVLLLRALGYRVLADINKVAVVMPAALVGTVILTLRGRGVARSELIRRVDWLKDAITLKGYKVADFGTMTTAEVVDRTTSTVMKGLITEQKDVLEPTFLPEKRFELSFYRNQVIHIFVSEALASAALYTKVKQGGTAPMQRMTRSELLRECSFISSVLRNEFVFGTDTLEGNVDKTIEGMVADGILQLNRPGVEGESEGEETIEISMKEREIGRENFDSFLFLIWPFIEGYWLAAVTLLSLLPSSSAGTGSIAYYNLSAHTKHAQQIGKTLYAQGQLAYLESINAAVLSQAFSRFQEMGVLLRDKSTPRPGKKVVDVIAINPDWYPPPAPAPATAPHDEQVRKAQEHQQQQQRGHAPHASADADGDDEDQGKLYDLIQHLGHFRREGKDRREQSVASRILGLVSIGLPEVVEFRRNRRGHRESANL
ncbi:uncharacterized protein PFL1_03340 [Pseudozyma flocculosa PF-1]|uniref:Related to bacterial glycerol-3-phosphate acyltransferases n=2 Tax=Pseudozyma flocculosa TaxID=84751 RepID=A0A5C3F8R2_9BASI|nr:uncharacterized protein PFL1_03340 [Pseudozyma flocculosa PF-1]EPQ29051.1 hypothetical protein PFL1_03340 [Pseudozyma flocculosa PF-1]SPO40045.1 related to bacterial glycerol-3-phosphate acyltransferases [Pseudozyma flocculosa]